MLISTWLTAVRNRLHAPRVVKRRVNQKQASQASENLETRSLLTAPTLVAIRPNVGDLLVEGETRNAAPRELTLQFNPGQLINTTNLSSAIQVTRGGADRLVNGSGDVPVTIGFVGVGDSAEEIVVRFAEDLPDDTYRITIRGTGPNALRNQANEIFNNGVDLNRTFRLDLGAVVEGVVPQPVLRVKSLNINNVSQIADGDLLSVSLAGTTTVFEFNSTGTTAPGNIALTFSPGQLPSEVAEEIRSKLVGESLPANISRSGAEVTISGVSFTPTIVKTMANSASLSIADGALVQRRNQVIVHFNEDDLDATLAENPSFYRLINTSGTLTAGDDTLLLPSSVNYIPSINAAVLNFAAPLANATYALRIGSNSEQETLAGAIDIGTLLGNSYQTNGAIGIANDVDLYKFNLDIARTISTTVTPEAGNNVVLRLFDSSGNPLNLVNAGGAGAAETLTLSLNAGTYFLGISTSGNQTYVPGVVSNTPGSTTGSYRLNVGSLTPFTMGDDNSSLGTATDLGSLGAANQSVNGVIQTQGIPLPQYAGATDEPGHRDIPAEQHIGNSGTGLVTPNGIRLVQYYFGNFYGVDAQGNDLNNAITENQKQRTREIFEIWSKKAGFVVEETTGTGIQIITGDLRAKAPTMQPNAVAGLGAFDDYAIMNGNTDWGKSEYGGAWFGVALHEIGHALGLDHAYDLISVMGEGEDPTANTVGREPIFPTDHDIIHMQRLDRPDSTDIDMYEFDLPTAGKFSAEVFAQRTNSRLDSVLRLYDTNGVLVAQNDNYNSEDAFVGLELAAGRYFIGVSSTGNDAYDPAISNTGFGGTTAGNYELRLSFESGATNKLTDAPLVAFAPVSEFDGDADGVAGGEYEFHFQAANTVFVDKAAANGGDGSLFTPYNRIDLAVAAATPGSIIRVVGNGGTDGNELTANDAKPYLIGVTPSFSILEDGGTLEVPQGVTLMIDADAVIKLQSANIDAGTSSQGIDRSNGAIQILGVPSRPVYLTSYLNDSLGGDSNGVGPAASGGNWGGVVFRDDSDYEAQGIFLNYVNKASISFGGGQVDVDSVPEIFTPIHLVSARPTVTFNTLTNNFKAAISANPNSFDDSGDRVGPEIYGNTLTNNTINGLFVRIKTELGAPIDTLDVSARFDDDDIVHVITENLAITGNPGGGLNGASRLSGRLMVDPGVVLKMGGSRIEAMLGNSNFMAEGTAERPVVITSTLDDQFGIGGTFDTTNNGTAQGAAAGDWGGIFFNATSSGSIDHAILRYGGGKTPIEGEFNEFNLIEIHQADVRVAHSRLEMNANGTGVSGIDATRNGRGTNSAATIFVRGAQPIILDNQFSQNAGFVVSIDVNSLNSFSHVDRGRSTGRAERDAALDDNRGALVQGNLLRNNGVNGMEVRGGTLTTQSIWDDTDIVHVLLNEVFVTNHHTYSGIRLQSKPTESLVVKLSGNNAGFTAGGHGMDIDDRIGGTVQVIGSPGFPVILTSLHDDSVGAGFDFSGFPVTDTNNNGNATTPAANNWRSIELQQFSNDRNVRVVMETEKVLTGGQDQTAPQLIGTLAPNEKSGDDNRPLGFEIHGHISPDSPVDRDTYSFEGIAGSEVWLDLDRTSSSLDTVLELVSSNGNVLAKSDSTVPVNTPTLSGIALPMEKNAALGGDHYTLNHRDEGFRVILPGTAGARGTYFVRVSSKSGLTSGAYQLQVRVNQKNEVPGSTVRFADIRFATNGIEIYGLPQHSPLAGEAGEATGDNNSQGGAQFLGHLLESDRNALSVSGSLSSAGDIDWFSFSVDYDFIQAIGGVNAGGKSWATVFDIDYADGMSRPDTILSVYDQTGRLILVSRDSDVLDDQPVPGTGTGPSDLTRGSAGKLDPFIGSVQLPERNDQRYFVTVSSNGRMPSELNQSYSATAQDLLARLEPVSSLRRIVEDHIGFQGYSTYGPFGPVPVNPDRTEGLFNISNATRLDTHVKPFSLGDVSLFTMQGNNLTIRNPFTGALVVSTGGNADYDDIAMRPDGRLYGITNGGNGGGGSGTLQEINQSTGNGATIGDDGIPTANSGLAQDHGGMAFRRENFGNYELYVANNNGYDHDADANTGDILPGIWRLNPNSGAAIDESTATNVQRVGGLPAVAPGVDITGLAFSAVDSGTLFAVDSTGALWQGFIGGNNNNRSIFWSGTAIQGDVTTNGVGFTGLTLGPQNVEDGAYANMLFATGTDGRLYAFSQAGVLQNVFDSNADGVADSSSVSFAFGTRGLAFSPLDFNLWHPTLRRRGDAGHGINAAIDNSRPDNARVINGRNTGEFEGGASFYFGLEQWQQDPSNNGYFQYNGGNAGQLGVLNAGQQRDLTTNATIANTYNLPGGASGSLVTNSFSLEGYRATDRPTVYFNYFLDTENVNVTNGNMRDAARVFVSTDGGTTWDLAATNNSVRSSGSELPFYPSASGTQSPNDPRQHVQELFDSSGSWRQARIDLGKYAGSADVKFRFDFTTSGNIGDAVDNNTFGNVNNRERSLNNQFEGFYIDDIIVGFAGRGEMVTSDSGPLGGAFVDVPADAFAQQLAGEYQLEIRRGSEYGNIISPQSNALGLSPALLMNADQRLVSEYSLVVPTASVIQPGDSYVISDGIVTRTFVFNPITALPTGSFAVNVLSNATKGQVATALATAINNVTGFNVEATTRASSHNSDVVDLTGAMNVTTTAIAAPETLTVSAPTSTTENTLTNSLITITRSSADTSAPLTISVSALNPANLTATAEGILRDGAVTGTTITVTIPVNQSSVTIQFDPTDDVIYDGTRPVLIRATATGFVSVTDIIDVTDNDPNPIPLQPSGPFGALGITLNQSTVTEDGGNRGVTGYITLPQVSPDVDPYDGANPLTVTITSTDGTEIRSTATTFVDGQIRAFFSMDIIDEFFTGPNRSVQIFATAPGYTSASGTVTVNTSGQVRYVDRIGDKNQHRQQGMVVIESNTVRNFGQFGIVSDAAPRSQGNQSNPGSVQNLSVLNNQRLVPGITIRNNVVANIGTGGILFSGDTNGAGQALAPVPFGKIINNTIYGGSSATGIGIRVEQNAGPTLLNNVISNTATGISIDGSSSASTVVATSLFKGNTSNGTVGSDSISLLPTEALFVNPNQNNYYPAPGSRAVDSSLDILSDRPAFTAVKTPAGIPSSDLVAPEFDLFGQKRLDDGSQSPPPGLGNDIFKDRGAIERADFLGPFATFTVPAEDNKAGDLDGNPTRIHVDNLSFPTTLSLDLLDTGIGVDDLQVRSSQFRLFQNGVLQLENIDYRWRYNPNNNRVYFVSVTTFPVDTRYSITVDNTALTGVRDMAGNRLQGNQADGTTSFTLLLTDGTNNAPVNSIPPRQNMNEDATLTFSAANNNAITVADQDAYLGLTSPSANLTALDGVLTVTLQASNGVLTLGDTSLVNFLIGDGTNDAMMRFTGTITDINEALDGLVYDTDQDFAGLVADAIRITTTDSGNFGPTPVTVRTTISDVEVDVLEQNDNPSFSFGSVAGSPPAGPVAIAPEDDGPQSIANFLTAMTPGPANESTQVLSTEVNVLSVTSDWLLADFFKTAPTINASGRLEYETEANVNGTALVEVIVKDDEGGVSAARTFRITATAVNDEPQYTRNSVTTVTSDEGESLTQNINVALITNFSTGPTGADAALDEIKSPTQGGQRVIWTVTSSVPTGNLVFDVLQINPNGSLEYRAKKDTAGTATLTVSLEDNGAQGGLNDHIADTFTININIIERNDAPVAVTGNYTVDESYPVTLNASNSFDVDDVFGDQLMYAWDLNYDGDYLDANEGNSSSATRTLSWSQLVAAGITAPASRKITLRVTDSRNASNSVTEVDANLWTLTVDYGDAPNTYGTTKASGGAAHTIAGTVFLGTSRDKEDDGQPSLTHQADRDDLIGIDDENGVFFPTSFETSPTQALPAYVDVVSSGAGRLYVWLDRNGDGDFDVPTEQLNGGLPWTVSAGVNRINFTIPAGAPVDSMMRFRLTSVGHAPIGPKGRANDGEVEDYAVKIRQLQNPVSPTISLTSVTTDKTPTISWSQEPENFNYQLIVRNSNNIIVYSRLAATRYTATSDTVNPVLVPGIYTVTLTAYNKAGVAAADSTRTFEVANLAITSPMGSVNSSRPTLVWQHVPGSKSYTIQIFSSPSSTLAFQQTVLTTSMVTPGQYTLPQNLPLGSYFARIRATDSSDHPGDWSLYQTFLIRTAPVVLLPSAVVITPQPQISWTPITGAVSYNVELFNMTDNTLVSSVTGVQGTTWSPTTPLSLARYRIFVRAVNSAGLVGFASNPRYFNYAPVPTVINPGGRLPDSTPTFGWQAVPSANLYQLVVRQDFGSFNEVYRVNSLTGTIHTLPFTLPLGRYTYSVVAINTPATGISEPNAVSSQSLETTFAVVTPPDVLGLQGTSGPVSTTFLTRPTIVWTNPPGTGSAARSELILFRKEGATDVLVLSRTNISGTSFTVPTDLQLGSYSVQVRTTSSVDPATVSDWSTARTFRVTVAPTLIGPSGKVADSTPTLNWTGVPGGQSYQVEVRSLSKNVVAFAQSGLNALNFTVPSDLPIGLYQFRVQARSAFGELSDWSSPMNFQVVGGPVLSGPGSSTFDTTPSFTWSNMGGTVGGSASINPAYDFRLDIILPNGTSQIVQANYRVAQGLSTTSYTIPTAAALPAGLYRAMVRARTADTTSNYSNIVEFIVGGNPVVTAIGSTTDTTPTINWRAVDGASGYQIFIALDSNPTVAVVEQTGIGSLSYTPPVALAKGRYRVWVRAVNSSNGQLSGPALTDAPSIIFTIVDASESQPQRRPDQYTMTLFPVNMEEVVSESTISMLPAFISGSQQPVLVVSEQTVDSSVQLKGSVPAQAENAVEVAPENVPQTDEVLSQWDEQKWWDAVPAPVVAADVVAAEPQPVTSASSGILGALLALAPRSLRRRKKDESAK